MIYRVHVLNLYTVYKKLLKLMKNDNNNHIHNDSCNLGTTKYSSVICTLFISVVSILVLR